MNYETDEHGTLFTKLNGKYHSFNDRPAKIYANGDQFWYKEGKYHRDHFPGQENDLPAVIFANDNQIWFKEGKIHREDDLPAIIRTNGICEWWINGEFIKRCDNYVPRVKSARNI